MNQQIEIEESENRLNNKTKDDDLPNSLEAKKLMKGKLSLIG